MQTISQELYRIEKGLRAHGASEEWIRAILKWHIDGWRPQDILEIVDIMERLKEIGPSSEPLQGR
ncbi:hypothetical protein IMZ31_22045 (plasmid) [Pontibacillus sp. ALD_SL1]|uniref:hypothetical protein n=1 Tax=Pontibacillus sp. ALD_SL1 TaxID=2777185 RepID=UPI001A96D543|nr:hypothetical protein [Pontibacillus sp. ALD_SL1]QST02136.1 hypothetical protein IMZ31_22045 [Pontibacillus sp. ALD_SL1]